MRSILALVLFVPSIVWSQTNLVSTSPENRSVLLEHFTGINSGEGVAGYEKMSDMQIADSENRTVISYHAGGGAQPIAGQPDFQTMYGSDLMLYFSIQQSPRGMFNRRQYSGSFQTHYDDYMAAANQTDNLSSPVNLGMLSTFDAATRDLSVQVEVYYTANGAGANDHISVSLVESNIIAEQIDFFDPNGVDTAYSHQWLFREALTAQWGDELTINTMGHSETRTYTLNNVDNSFDISNCYVVAHIGDFQGEVFQAKFVPANGGSTQVGIEENSLSATLGSAYPNPANETFTVPFIGLEDDVFLQVTDATGKLVVEAQIASGVQAFEIDAKDFSAGLYSYRVISASGLSSSAKTIQKL